MSQLTKQAIIDCTLDLAEKKSFSKITVRDIVTACHITRNTFYYYFHDIYDVVDQAIEAQAAGLTTMQDDKWEDAIFRLIEFAARRKRVWQNLYRSIGHEEASRFITTRLHRIIVRDVDRLTGGATITEHDRYIICSFYEEALFGIMTRWLKDSTGETSPEQLAAHVRRIECIFAGHLRLAIENALQHPET